MDPVHARTLRIRAARLRRLALESPEPLAGAYRRRACELEFLRAVYAPRSPGGVSAAGRLVAA